MERSSYFIEKKGLFGSFPEQEAVKELEDSGVRHFIDLTHSNESKIVPYKTKYNYISFPITDHQIPRDIPKFSAFIVRIADIICNLKNEEMVYIHCKGGHGRSGIVVASLLCRIFDLTPTQALEHTTLYHSNRKSMREKWRKIGSPQTYQQKNFVYQLYKRVNFYRAYKTGRTAGFSNFTPFSVDIPGFGIFPTAEAAMQAYKDSNNEQYVLNQSVSRSPLISQKMGEKITVRSDWEEVREDLQLKVLQHKFDQHPQLRETLLQTGLSTIIHHTKKDQVFGVVGSSGLNILGKSLVRLRTQYQRAG